MHVVLATSRQIRTKCVSTLRRCKLVSFRRTNIFRRHICKPILKAGVATTTLAPSAVVPPPPEDPLLHLLKDGREGTGGGQ